MGEVGGTNDSIDSGGDVVIAVAVTAMFVLQSCDDKETTIRVLVMEELNNEKNATTKLKGTYIGIV